MYSIQQHLQYSAWAAVKIADILRNTDEALWDKELVSSFPTIRKTIYHIWDAELIWLERIKGNALTEWPSTTAGVLSKEDFLKQYTDHTHNLTGFFADKDRAYLESSITYKNLKGVEFTTPIEQILFHVVNHGSFHRGQLVTMMRTVGITQLQSTDLINYLRL